MYSSYISFKASTVSLDLEMPMSIRFDGECDEKEANL